MTDLEMVVLSALGSFIGITLHGLLFVTQVSVKVNPGDLWEEYAEEEE